MKYIRSTYEIMAFKVLNRDIDEGWVNWAYEMMLSGAETENLVILAGISAPFHQFPLQELTTRVFNELQLDLSAKDSIVKGYVNYLIEETLTGKRDVLSILKTFKDLYYEMDHAIFLRDFHLLYFAKDDLLEYEDQWYWPNANRGNIDSIITERFEHWRDAYQNGKNSTYAARH